MWIPAVLFYFTENLITLYHPGATWLMMLQVNELAVPELFKPVGYMLGHDMGMYIDLSQGQKFKVKKLNSFIYDSSTLPYTYAHGSKAIFTTTALQFIKQRCRYTRTATTQWVTYCNSTAIHIYFLFIKAQILHAGDTLCCESFIQFYQVEILHFKACTF
jgi:hypothetical protein